MNTSKFKLSAIVLSVLSIVIVMVLLGPYFSTFKGSLSSNPAAWGQFGDYLSGIGSAVFGAATVALIGLTITLQASELEELKEEIGLLRRQDERRELVQMAFEVLREIGALVEARSRWSNAYDGGLESHTIDDRLRTYLARYYEFRAAALESASKGNRPQVSISAAADAYHSSKRLVTQFASIVRELHALDDDSRGPSAAVRSFQSRLSESAGLLSSKGDLPEEDARLLGSEGF